MHIPILIRVLLVTALVNGCSSTSLVYNNAPWFIENMVDDYFSLTAQQEKQLEQDIEALFEWHRRNELAQYARMLAEFNAVFSDGLTAAEYDSIVNQLINARARVAEASIAAASALLTTLTSSQLDHYELEFQEQLEESREILQLPAEQRDAEIFERLLDRLEDWFGNFDDAQLQEIRRLSLTLPDNRSRRLQERERRHQAFVDLMRNNPDRDAIQSYLRSRFVKWQLDSAEEYSKNLKNRAYWKNMLLEIDRIITTAQRHKAMQRVQEYSQDFIILSKQNPGKAELPSALVR